MSGASVLFLSGALAAEPERASPADEAALAGPDSALDALKDQELRHETIVRTGKQDGYVPQETVSATKTATALVDIPQSISVITRDLLDDQAIRSLDAVIRLVPGATIGQGEGHRDQVTIRGNNTTADFFVDGLRDDVQFFRHFYNVERVEVLKGPNALIFGRGGGGGVVNRVTKIPFSGDAFSFEAGADTFGAYILSADANKTLSETTALRLNALYEDGRNHRDVFEFERIGFNPTFGWRPTEATRLVIGYEYASDDRIVDRGVPSIAGLPARGFDRQFFGSPELNESDLLAHVVTARAEHDVNDNLTLDAKFSFGTFDKTYRNVFPATPISINAVTGAQQVGIEAYLDPTERENIFGQSNLTWRASGLGTEHIVLAGIEFGNQTTVNQRINGFFDSGVPTTVFGRRTVIPVTDPLAIPPITFRPGNGNRSVRTGADIYSVYVQDQIGFGRWVDVIIGVRFDQFNLEVQDFLANATFVRNDSFVSPRVGVTFKPVEAASLYGSFSRSFLPQSGDQFLSLDLSLAALEPERFDNYEIGAKWDITARIAVNLAVYQLERLNTRAPAAEAGVIVLTGAQRSRGVEASLSGAITEKWNVSLAYTFQDAEITETTTAAPAGRQVGQVPRHVFSAWSRYDVFERFGIGLGVFYQGDSFATISNAVTLPDFVRIDAALFFRLTEKIEAQINIENIGNTDFFPTAHTDNNITTGASRSARFTIRARY